MTHARSRIGGPVSTWAAVLGLWGGLCGCGGQNSIQAPPQPPVWLTIVTPHSECIRQAFQRGFGDWYYRTYNTTVFFDWVALGTPECVRFVTQMFETPARDGRHARPDVFFGGATADHAALARRGVSRKVDVSDALRGIPAEVNGIPMRDPGGRWYAIGLTSFGIIYNAKRLKQWGIPAPQTWSDLADPRLRSWLALADPDASGSNREPMILIWQKAGWEAGWSTLIRILANARAISPGSPAARKQVETGVSLAAFAVSFDGLALAAGNSGALEYVNPAGATAVSPGATSVLTSSMSPEIATDFVKFCLSEAGQQLWAVKERYRSGTGPTLYSYPIRPSLYDTHAGKLSVSDNPFTKHFGLRLDLEQREEQKAILVPLVQAACGENHVLLQRAWAAVIASGMQPAALAELTRPPFDEATALDLGQQYEQATRGEREKLLADWANTFREKYTKVIELAE